MAAYDYINLSGTIVADTSTTKTEVQGEYIITFGDGIDLSDESPEGALIASETIARNGVAVNNALLANQINPNYSGGVYLDAVWALTAGVTGGRQFATFSTFSSPVPLTGVPGTLIPSGAIGIVSATGDEFASVADVTLDGSGLASVNFQAVLAGPRAVAIGELDTLAIGAVLGWETISNTVAATQGRNDESDEASRFRRKDTLAEQSISVAKAVTSAISGLDGVRSLTYRENYTDTDDTIDGIFLLKNSIYVCVDGGLDADIFNSLLDNKTPGSNWNGSETDNVVDPTSGQTYLIKFDRPTSIDTWIRVTIAPTTVSNPEDVVNASVLAYANGLIDGERGLVIDADVSPFEVGSAVNNQTPEIFVRKVETSTDNITYIVAEIPIAIDEIAVTDSGKITTVIT